MKIALTTTIIAIGFVAYTAWLNGFFTRCPNCRKIGWWRFDAVESEVEEKDVDGILLSCRQVKRCRKCQTKVLASWSDHDGRQIEKLVE